MAEVVDSIIAELIARDNGYIATFDRAIAKHKEFTASIPKVDGLAALASGAKQYADQHNKSIGDAAKAEQQAAAAITKARKSVSDADKQAAADAKAAAKSESDAAKAIVKAQADAEKAAAKRQAAEDRAAAAAAKSSDAEKKRAADRIAALRLEEQAAANQARAAAFLTGSRPTTSTGISGLSEAGTARSSAAVFQERFTQEAEGAKLAAAAEKELAAARVEAAGAAETEAEATERLRAMVASSLAIGGVKRGSGANLGASVPREVTGQGPANFDAADGAKEQVEAEREINHLMADQADLQAGLTVARGKERDIIRDQLTELRLVNQYKRAGLTDEEAAIRAESTLLRIEEERAAIAERQKTVQVGQFAAGAGLGRFGGVNAATAGIAAATVFVGGLAAISSSVDFAKEIQNTAEAIGLTTKQVQVYEAAARQAGVSTDQFRSGIGQLSSYLGRAKEGDEQAAKTFQALGINIKNAGSAGDILPTLIDRISSIPDAAQRAAVETRLFGEEGRRLDAVLSGGNERVNDLALALEKTGAVLTDADIQKLADTSAKLAQVKAQLQVDLAQIVANNADAITSLAKSFADLANTVGGAIKALDNFQNSTGVGKLLGNPAGAGASIHNSVVSAVKDFFGIKSDEPATPEAAPAFGSVQAGKTGNLSNLFAPKGPKGKSADQLQAEADARTKRFNDQMRQYQVEELQAQAQQNSDELERSALAVQQINIERLTAIKDAETQADADVRRGADKKLTAERLKQVIAAINLTSDQKIEAENLKDRISALNKATAVANQTLGFRADELRDQESLATTAAERRRIETQLLENSMQQERNTANNVLDRAATGDPSITSEQIATSKATLKSQPARQASQQAAINANNAGPLGDYLKTLPTTADRLDEAFQNAAVDGLGALNDGITAAITGTKSLGDAFHDVAQQIIADLVKIAVEREIVEPLAGALFGASGGGGAIAGFFSDILGGHRASGGNVAGGSTYLVGEYGPELFKAPSSGTIVPNNRAAVGGRGLTVMQTINVDGRNSVTPSDFADQIVSTANAHANRVAVYAAQTGAQGGVSEIKRQSSRPSLPRSLG